MSEIKMSKITKNRETERTKILEIERMWELSRVSRIWGKKVCAMMLVMLSIFMTCMLASCGEAPKGAAGGFQGNSHARMDAGENEDSVNAESDEGGADEGKKAGNTELKPFQTSATIEETVLLDENNVKITARNLEYDKYSVKLNVLIENNGEQDLSFICGSLGYCCNEVNGYMVGDGYLNVDVTAGNKANEKISFSIDNLRILGITEIADIKVGFEIQNDNYDSFYSGARQVRTSIADTYDDFGDTYRKTMGSKALEKEYDISVEYFAEDILAEQDGVRIVSAAVVKNKDGEENLFLEVENHSAEGVYVSGNEFCINGLSVPGTMFAYDFLNPGARKVVTVSLDYMLEKPFRECFGIKEIDDISFSFKVDNADMAELWSAEDICLKLSKGAGGFDGSGEEVYNENGIQIRFKELLVDLDEFDGDIHAVLLVENETSGEITVSDVYDSLSVNGFMMDYSLYGVTVEAGKCAMLDVRIWEDSLEENEVASVEDIKELVVTLEIRTANYDTIAEPKVKVVFE